ncbi:hypothetical protein [Chryseobacterium gambrini]|uniref:hypothetical protein n=1 Tax=Chryseobacterium gambrini TaxID=373672 RepID=UPI0022F37D59|nr:hypothetical protein [Chryseobacterium gambrini]WBX98005.1 hypothetical protein PE065_01830 [Chryseobacterium gambrini]
MKKIFFYLLFFIYSYSYSQEGCKLKFTYKADSILFKNNFLQLKVENTGKQKIKIFKKLSVANFQIHNIEKYNDEKKQFEKINYSGKDIQILPKEKDFINLRKNKSHIYLLNIQDLIYHGRKYIGSGKYRFTILFEYIDLSACNFSTDFLYYNFEK